MKRVQKKTVYEPSNSEKFMNPKQLNYFKELLLEIRLFSLNFWIAFFFLSLVFYLV